ncbi:hypothetical protein HanOQP8_Chr16g0615081 [Helianthus annuus]|nr:hypothetical protein HanOQP8_Chr16g0615081 [Helianthus annuus]
MYGEFSGIRCIILSDRTCISKSDFQDPAALQGLIIYVFHIIFDFGICMFLSEKASKIMIDRNMGKGRCESILPVLVRIDLLIRLNISVPKSIFNPVMRLNMIVRTFIFI